MIRERFPDKKILLSEACIEFSKYSAAEHLKNAQKYAHDIIGDLNAGTSTFLDWNLVLNEQGGPNYVGNFCDAPFLFDTSVGKLMEQELQGYLWHFSHFLTPGAMRIGISKYTETIEATAFQTDEQITVVLLNRTTEPLDLYLRIQNVCAPLTLPPQSIATGAISLN